MGIRKFWDDWKYTIIMVLICVNLVVTRTRISEVKKQVEEIHMIMDNTMTPYVKVDK